jgi:hypothetical protein
MSFLDFPGAPASPAFPVNASSGNVSNAVASATLAAVTGKTNFLTGLEVTGSGATAGSVVVGTITGVVGGPLSYAMAIPAGVTLGAQPLCIDFSTPLAATAQNVAIVVSFPTFGAGNTNANVNARGFKL